MRPRLTIVCPATAQHNNGNWHGAARWARFLRARYRVEIRTSWTADDPAPDLLLALHARRSAAAVAAFARAHPGKPLLLALTGTDLYRDIESDASARASLESASHLVLLQEAGLERIPPALRAKCTVIFQSARALAPWPRPSFDIVMLGHLREEKDPAAFMHAAAFVTAPGARLLHVGAALEPQWEAAALAAQARHPNYRWLGPLPRAQARQRLRRAHAMALCSRMEGGANVIVEAVTSGVPVLASDISGNRGMLGRDYAGYFPQGDANALARLIDRSLLDADFDALLRRQCTARAPLFAEQRERADWLALVDNALFPSDQATP